MAKKFNPFEELDNLLKPSKWERREVWVIPGPAGYVLGVYCSRETGEYRAYLKRNFAGSKWVNSILTSEDYHAIKGTGDPLAFLRRVR